MAVQWIPAKQAFDIIGNERTLTNRLRSGVLKSKAAKIQSTHDAFSCNPVTADFWETGGRHDFRADWETGDFTNHIDGEIAVYVFGLTIDLSGILEMLPAEERGLIALNMSVAGSPQWITAKEACSLSFKARGDLNASREWIYEQGRLGFFVARAVQAETELDDRYRGRAWVEREWDVPTWFWSEFTKSGFVEPSWTIGRLSGEGPTPHGFCSLTLSGLHFHKRTFLTLLGLPTENDTSLDDLDGPGERRGRRPSYDWPLAISTVWGKLLRSELLPEIQTDIEIALIAALKVGDKEPSISSVRPYAKTIFEEYSKP